MKKIWICLTLLSTVLIGGCSSNIDDKYEIKTEQIEKANIQNDYMIFEDIQSVYKGNMKKAKTDDQKCVVMLKYLDDVYQMAGNRYNLDAKLLANFSDVYLDYVAGCKVYSETYLKERDDLIKDKNIMNESYVLGMTDTGIMLGQLDYMFNQFETQYGF